MKIIVDTSVWSLFLRRTDPVESSIIFRLREAIQDRKVQMLGIVRQELLSGIREKKVYSKISDLLSNFPDLLATSEDHTQAAIFFNICRKNGIQGSPVDFLICAQAHRNKMTIMTTDNDFLMYAKHIPIDLTFR